MSKINITYYLDDIADYLEANGIHNINVDHNDESQESGVSIVSLPGEQAAQQYHSNIEFNVFVHDKRRQQARLTAEKIYRLLHNKTGKLVADPGYIDNVYTEAVKFLNLSATSSGPSYYKTTDNGATSFIMIFNSNIIRPDLTGSTKSI